MLFLIVVENEARQTCLSKHPQSNNTRTGGDEAAQCSSSKQSNDTDNQ